MSLYSAVRFFTISFVGFELRSAHASCTLHTHEEKTKYQNIINGKNGFSFRNFCVQPTNNNRFHFSGFMWKNLTHTHTHHQRNELKEMTFNRSQKNKNS